MTETLDILQKKMLFFPNNNNFSLNNNNFDDFSFKKHVYFEQGRTLKLVSFFMLFKGRLKC